MIKCFVERFTSCKYRSCCQKSCQHNAIQCLVTSFDRSIMLSFGVVPVAFNLVSPLVTNITLLTDMVYCVFCHISESFGMLKFPILPFSFVDIVWHEEHVVFPRLQPGWKQLRTMAYVICLWCVANLLLDTLIASNFIPHTTPELGRSQVGSSRGGGAPSNIVRCSGNQWQLSGRMICRDTWTIWAGKAVKHDRGYCYFFESICFILIW